MPYFKYLWIIGLLCFFCLFFGVFPSGLVASLGLLAWILWASYLFKSRPKSAKRLFLGLMITVISIVGIYQFLAYYGMKDSTLQKTSIFAKACGNFSHEGMDTWTCEKNCKFHDGKIEMFEEKNGQLSSQPFLTGDIVERDWRYGQPVLYIRFGNDKEISRYCLK